MALTRFNSYIDRHPDDVVSQSKKKFKILNSFSNSEQIYTCDCMIYNTVNIYRKTKFSSKYNITQGKTSA